MSPCLLIVLDIYDRLEEFELFLHLVDIGILQQFAILPGEIRECSGPLDLDALGFKIARVESAMSGESVFFPPYSAPELAAVVEPRVQTAFRERALSEAVFEEGVQQAANRWGDARKTLTLFRQAGETANERGLAAVTSACLDANIDATERDAVLEKLGQLPRNHLLVLVAITGRWRGEEVVQPVETAQIESFFQNDRVPAEVQLGARAIRDLVTDLETMGLVETWIESRGRGGRAKQLQTTFDPSWVRDAAREYGVDDRESTAVDERDESPE